MLRLQPSQIGHSSHPSYALGDSNHAQIEARSDTGASKRIDSLMNRITSAGISIKHGRPVFVAQIPEVVARFY